MLNFFYLDTESEEHDPVSYDLMQKYSHYGAEVSSVVPARFAHAVETDPPARASVFDPIPWAAKPGFAFPDTWDPAWNGFDVGPDADDMARAMPGNYVENRLTEWSERPGALDSEDMAFGRPQFPTGSSPMVPFGKD
ncbi:hypothetical protein AB4Z54_68615, partial [Streptomyces sp. MCAF7]